MGDHMTTYSSDNVVLVAEITGIVQNGIIFIHRLVRHYIYS